MLKKRIFAIVFVLILIVFFIVWEQISVHKSLDRMLEITNVLIEASKDATNIQTQEYKNKLIRLENEWEYYENVIAYVVNYKDIKELGIEISKLYGNIEVNQTEDFYAGLLVIRYLLQSYEELIAINFSCII